MKKQTISIIAISSIVIFASCNKKSAPIPDEQELITTVSIQVGQPLSSLVQTFSYKIENGFSSGTSGIIKIDSIKLKPNTVYDATLIVLNEKANPIQNITTEIIEKDFEHLFLFASTPATGNGSLVVSDGNKDKNGAPFNQTFKLTTGPSGTGKFKIQLMHQPTNKNATTPETSGGETDLEATFPVVLQ